MSKITTPSGTVYQFVYDDFGRTTQIKVGNTVLSETEYKNVYSSLVSRMTYGNEVYRTYEYDDLDRLISEGVNGAVSRTYLYDKQSNLVQVTDFLANVTTKFQYDLIGRTIGMNMSDGQSLRMIYDNYNRVSLLKWSLGEEAFHTGYIYGDNTVAGQQTSLLYGVTLNGEEQIGYTYDELTRLESKTLATEVPFVTEYGYLEGSTVGTTTTLVKTVKNGNTTLEYAYDAVGNITSVKKNGVVIEMYTYDALNQLTGATYGGNTYTYAYDHGENITEVKKNGTVIKSYTYGNANWKDQLTAFNGEYITYDEIGNPLTYRNNLSFTWQNGRQLATIMQNGNQLAAYTYNADGLRTSKTVSGVTTEYYWMNGTLYAQKTGEEYIYFLYDESGIAYGFVVKNNTEETTYYYEFNLQGDIIGIINSAGTRVVEYTYGAWGDILSISGSMASTIGQKNPLRYRGYYYDGETGFYYLQSRYYDAEIARFLNVDRAISGIGENINGYNLYSYCFNNPLIMCDSTGDWPLSPLSKLFVKVVSVIVRITFENHKINANNKKQIDDEIETSYTQEAAKEEIDEILGKYGDNVTVSFNDDGVEITNSIKVRSRYDRQKISAIITRTDNLTNREYDDIAAEWLFHNIAYDLNIKRDSAISANLDYTSDSRWYVSVATDLLEFFGWE